MDSNSIIDAHQNLPEWVSNFDKRFLSKLDLKERGHQYFNDTYNACFNIRDDFRNNFLPKLESDLGFPSSSKYYKYEYFFKSQDFPEFELSNNYYYDNNINLLKKNYSCTNIKTKETSKDNMKNIKQKTNDKLNYNNNYHNSYKNNQENKNEEEKVNIFNKSSQINKEKNMAPNNKNYLKSKNENVNNNNNKINYNVNNNTINKNSNQIYKKNEMNNQFQKNIESKKENNINKNIIIKNNSIENKNQKENIYTKKIEKNNMPNSATKIKINTKYNKSIFPIKEELNENDEETQNNISSKSSQKISNKTNQEKIYPQSQNTINKNKIYTKTPINRISNENNFSKNPNNLKSNTKRSSIKNYLLLKNSNLLENENIFDENPKIKAANNINHTRIKNYLRNANNEEDEKVGELSINIRKGNNAQMKKRIMRESKSSYDVFKKTPVKK